MRYEIMNRFQVHTFREALKNDFVGKRPAKIRRTPSATRKKTFFENVRVLAAAHKVLQKCEHVFTKLVVEKKLNDPIGKIPYC